jgi:nitric oxide reductase NorD protein
VRQADAGEDDDRPGTWMIRPDEPMESAEDPRGLQRPADRDEQADAADLADSLSELPEARVVQSPGRPREVLASDTAPAARAPVKTGRDVVEAGIAYPEWDYRLAAYRERAAIVRPGVAPAGSAAWVDQVMARHAALVRRVRRRFDGLRPRRRPVGRQADGPDLDLSAYVAAFADWRSSQPDDDRFYAAARPARRDLAIALLVDVSASTDGWVSGAQRIIDVEKESLIVLLEALDALGDRHAAFGFSGEGPAHVRVLTIKGFAEPTGPSVRRRVAALEPDRYTRVGAAIRHASALLAGQPARHHLLLVLSDGKPNDVDGYDGRYGVEDTRQAVAEARVQGLVPFCLTVDREAPAYMPSIFGRAHAVLRRQDLLPGVLVEVVRRLLVA